MRETALEAFLSPFSSLAQRSMSCAKLALLFPFKKDFLAPPYLGVQSLLYLRHSSVLWAVCAPPCLLHSWQYFESFLTFFGIQSAEELVPFRLPLLSAYPLDLSAPFEGCTVGFARKESSMVSRTIRSFFVDCGFIP